VLRHLMYRRERYAFHFKADSYHLCMRSNSLFQKLLSLKTLSSVKFHVLGLRTQAAAGAADSSPASSPLQCAPKRPQLIKAKRCLEEPEPEPAAGLLSVPVAGERVFPGEMLRRIARTTSSMLPEPSLMNAAAAACVSCGGSRSTASLQEKTRGGGGGGAGFMGGGGGWMETKSRLEPIQQKH
jgi:hypothetical protein